MDEDVTEIRDKILLAALPDVAFDGWTWEMVEAAAEKACGKDMASAVFPGKLKDVLIHFSDWADREMMAALAVINPENMRVRDRVKAGVLARLEILEPHKEAVRQSMTYWLRPFRKYEAGRMVWKTADRIWEWAGDTATDYNHYTKRGLLTGVITATTLAWINDDSADGENTKGFLDRRIENVMQLGKVTGKFAGFAGKFKRA